MKTISRKLLETAIRLAPCSSSDETRLYLNGVHVFKRDNTIILEATDGHKMVRETISQDDTDIGENDLILCRTDLKKLKPLLKTYKGNNVFNCELKDKSLVISCGVDIVSVFRIEREYPRMDGVIPTLLANAESAVSISFNPEYLLQLFESLKTAKKDMAITITFNPTNAHGALLVELADNKNPNQVAVVMPVNTEKSRASADRFNNTKRAVVA